MIMINDIMKYQHEVKNKQNGRLTMKVHIVLSEGNLFKLKVKDVL